MTAVDEMFAFLDRIQPMSSQLKTYLRRVVQTRPVSKDEFLLKAGEVCRDMVFIHSGLLRCYYLINENIENLEEEVTSFLLKEEDVVVSIQSFYKQVPGKEFIQALEDTYISCISFEDLKLAYQNYHEFCLIGIALTAEYLIKWDELLTNMRLLTARERYLIFEKVNQELLRRVPLKYIASFISMKGQTISRIRGSR